MEEKARKILEKLKEDPDSVGKLFGGVSNALDWISKISPKVYSEIDTTDDVWYDNELQDLIIYNQLNNSENIIEYLKQFIDTHNFGDLKVEGDRIIYESDIDDLLNLFDDSGRNSSAKSVVKLVLSDDFTEWFSHSDFDLEELINSLNKENLSRIKNEIITQLNNKVTKEDVEESEIELLEEMLEIQGSPEYLDIDLENISEILDDSESLTFVFENYLQELKSSLSNSYSQAYNSAYEDEVSDEVFSAIEDLLGKVTVNDYTITKIDGTKVYRRNYLIDVTENLPKIFLNYFSDYSDHSYEIDYYGNFTNMLNEYTDLYDKVDFRIPDYPDSSKVEEIYNEIVEM